MQGHWNKDLRECRSKVIPRQLSLYEFARTKKGKLSWQINQKQQTTLRTYANCTPFMDHGYTDMNSPDSTGLAAIQFRPCMPLQCPAGEVRAATLRASPCKWQLFFECSGQQQRHKCKRHSCIIIPRQGELETVLQPGRPLKLQGAW